MQKNKIAFLSLYIIEKLALKNKLKDWPNFGIALQAYGKRAFDVIEWLNHILNNRQICTLDW